MDPTDRRWRERLLWIACAVPVMALGYWFLAWWVKHVPVRDVSTALDDAIPLWPPAIWLYLLYYVFPLPLFFWTPAIGDYRRVCCCIVAQAVVGWFFFVGFPVWMDRPAVEPSDIQRRLIVFIYEVLDPNPGNCFPSEHVAISMLTAFMVWEHKRRLFAIMLVLAMGISASTVLVKQHYLADVSAGLALAIAAWWLFYRVPAVRDHRFFGGAFSSGGVRPRRPGGRRAP